MIKTDRSSYQCPHTGKVCPLSPDGELLHFKEMLRQAFESGQPCIILEGYSIHHPEDIQCPNKACKHYQRAFKNYNTR